MAGELTPAAILRALDEASYYEILGVPQHADLDWMQEAFHRFALEYHPDRHVQAPAETRDLVGRVFKRGTEAFHVLTDPKTRALYDDGLTRGQLRFVAGEAASAAVDARPKIRSLEEIAATPKARELARRADRLLAAGSVEQARILLTDAVQDDFENVELQARLRALYTAEGFERLSDVDEAPFER